MSRLIVDEKNLPILRGALVPDSAMQTLQGIAVSPGVAIGEALIVDHEGFRIPRRFVTRDAVEDELERFHGAATAVEKQIDQNRRTISDDLGEKYGDIFAAHLALLCDPQLRGKIEELIREQNYSPEYAISCVIRKYAQIFQSHENSFLAERANDLFDIKRQLLQNLLGRQREELSHLMSEVVVLAHDLTPSETAHLDRKFVLGFVTEVGGPGGHTSIVAKALEIPAVVGVGQYMVDVSGGEQVIIDGDHGRVILQPDEATLARYQREAAEHRSLAVRLGTLHNLPAETTDGVRIQLNANIEFPRESEICLSRGAAGIGLYRTEFLYLGTESEPTEEEHFKAYRRVVEAMGDREVVIRTLDLGADKITRQQAAQKENNPFLGLRSIRLSLRNLPLFRTQLRAILRASVSGDVRIMFPMVTTLRELRQAKMVLAEVMEDLDEESVPFDREIPVGIMVEVPATVLTIEEFVKEVDFLSIGTNDLTQYTLAIDRSNQDVASLYNASEPAVLRLIDRTIQAANAAQIEVGLCGQMAANPIYTMLLLGMGLRSLSVPPGSVPVVKKACRSVSIAQCEEVAQTVRKMETALQIDNYTREELKKIVPELLV